jgi:hypothetical protein
VLLTRQQHRCPKAATNFQKYKSMKEASTQGIRIKLINPNTTLSMTRNMVECAQRLAGPGTDIIGVSPDMGPPTLH